MNNTKLRRAIETTTKTSLTRGLFQTPAGLRYGWGMDGAFVAGTLDGVASHVIITRVRQ